MYRTVQEVCGSIVWWWWVLKPNLVISFSQAEQQVKLINSSFFLHCN